MNTQKMLMAVATTAVGFAFGLWAYNKFVKGKAMVSKAAAPTASVGAAMAMPNASSSAEDGL
jgi:hypothetical protein